MRTSLKAYRNLERHVVYLITAEFFLQLINASFFMLFNYFMTKQGYKDYLIAEIVSYRFLAVMLVAFPLGLFIKGRKLKPFFYAGALFAPLSTLVVVYAAVNHYDVLLNVFMIIWGAAFTCFQVTSLPYILLNARKETHSEAIALHFITFSLSICVAGTVFFTLNTYIPGFDEGMLFIVFAMLGLFSLFFVFKMNVPEAVSDIIPLRSVLHNYDWLLIARALMPTLLIAVGAGFTIPFINLFFYNVHGIDSNTFSMVGATTYLMVVSGVFFMPSVKRRFGYEVAITLIQSMAVIALVALASTEFYSHYWFAVYIAFFFYIIRQPLMNTAAPMTSELVLYYVGRKNQEVVSALNASLWSGSWFISSQLFRILRANDFRYAEIFMITALLYSIGVAWYYFLIKEYHHRRTIKPAAV